MNERIEELMSIICGGENSIQREEVENYINNLQSKIDKAIEFVEKESKICYTNKTTDDPQKVIGNFMWHTDKLLDILGENK